MAKRGLDNVSFIPSLPYATKRKGEKKEKRKEKRAISMPLDVLSFIAS